MPKCTQCAATTETADYLASFKGGLVLCCDCWEKKQAPNKRWLLMHTNDWEHVLTKNLERFCAQQLKREGYPTNRSLVNRIVSGVKQWRINHYKANRRNKNFLKGVI